MKNTITSVKCGICGQLHEVGIPYENYVTTTFRIDFRGETILENDEGTYCPVCLAHSFLIVLEEIASDKIRYMLEIFIESRL